MSRDPVEQLTVAELDAGSRLLGGDLIYAVSTPGAVGRWSALAIVAYLLDRRTDPTSTVGRFRAMTAGELTAALGFGGAPAEPPAEPPPAEPPAGETGGPPPDAGDVPVDGLPLGDQLSAELTADPTDPAPA